MIPDLMLERYRLGELSPDEAARIARRAEGDPILRSRLAALDASDASIKDGRETERLTTAVAARLSGRPPATRAFVPRRPLLVAWASAVVVLIAVAMWGRGVEPADRIKGDPASVFVYRRTAASSERLTDGDTARAGDVVRVAYRATAGRFGLILSMDGRGVVTRHLPVSGNRAAALQAGDAVPLDDAYELDDAPRWEQFVLITGESAFDIEPLVELARRVAVEAAHRPDGPPLVLTLPAGLRQTSFRLRKLS